MSNNLLLSGMTESFYEYWLNATYGPVNDIFLMTGGSAYANGDSLVFARSPHDTETTNAVATVLTSPTGAITSVSITNAGLYSIVPAISVSSSSGAGANLYCTIDADSYYLIASGTEPYSNEPTVDPIVNSVNGVVIDINQQMLFGMKIDKNSLSLVVPTLAWTSGTTYTQYDNSDPNLSSEMFYVVNNAGVVYKCINNAQGQPSTVQPVETEALSQPPMLSDGYQWLYLYTLPDYNSASPIINVIQEANTSLAAVPGAIYSVRVVSSGSSYPTLTGTILSTANSSGSVTLNNPPSVYSNYYKGCYLTVWGSGGLVNNYVVLTSSTGGTNQQLTVTGSFNANQISSGYQFTIGPAIQVTGDGSGFVAYADVSNVNGGISDVHVLSPGTGYHYANAYISSISNFGNGASLVTIISPPNGHGSNVAAELFANTISVVSGFSNSISNFDSNIPGATVSYRSIGILKNPMVFNSNNVYTDQSFSQSVVFKFNPQAAPFFAVGEIAVGSAKNGQVVVISANSVSGDVEVTGWDGTSIQVGEIVTGAKSTTTLTLNSIVGSPSLQPFTGQILYVGNFTVVTHSNTAPSDSFQILIAQ